jgi:hypothetical protein
MIKLTLEMSGEKYKTTGGTINEAFLALPLSWENIKAKGLVTIKDGKKSCQHLFVIKQLKRIFANKLTMMMWSKRLALFLQ